MGAAMAVSFRRAGYQTRLWMRDAAKLSTVRDTLKSLDTWMTEHIGPSASSTGTLDTTVELSDIDANATVIVDCIAERMDEKAELFSSLTAAKSREALFLTTTSGLSITELGRRSGTERRIVGTHFWNPPHLMPLVEIIRGAATEDTAVQVTTSLVQSIGKIPVQVNRDVPGFIGNRLLHALWREAIYLVQQGIATAEDVDRVARLTFGLRMPAVGPLENMDLVGLDLVHTIHQYLLADLSDHRQPLELLDQHVRADECGMKSGRGFYNWQTRSPGELLERRNQQIVQQLKFLKEINAL